MLPAPKKKSLPTQSRAKAENLVTPRDTPEVPGRLLRCKEQRSGCCNAKHGPPRPQAGSYAELQGVRRQLSAHHDCFGVWSSVLDTELTTNEEAGTDRRSRKQATRAGQDTGLWSSGELGSRNWPGQRTGCRVRLLHTSTVIWL